MADALTFTTCGDFQTEPDACHGFDKFVKSLDFFTVFKEVHGKYLYTPIFKDAKEGARIDRILLPKKDLIEAGFTGAIGIEIKKSGLKVSSLYNQLLDYHRCVWRLNSIAILLDYIFLFPCDKLSHGMASISDQNHIGTACIKYPAGNEWHRMQFFTGEHSIIEFYPNQANKIKIGNLSNGKRQGSR